MSCSWSVTVRGTVAMIVSSAISRRLRFASMIELSRPCSCHELYQGERKGPPTIPGCQKAGSPFASVRLVRRGDPLAWPIDTRRLAPLNSGSHQPSEVGIDQPGVTHDAPLRPGLEVGVAMDRDRGPAAGVGVSIDMMAAGDAGQPPAS